MATTNTITVINTSNKGLWIDKNHLHINHYDSPARQLITSKLGEVGAGEQKSCTIEADSSKYASTVEISYHVPFGSKFKTVRYYLDQDGSTKVCMNKNQTGIPAGAHTDGHHVFFTFG